MRAYIRYYIARICGYIRFRYKGKLNRKLSTLYIGVLSGIFIYKYPTYNPYIQDIPTLTKTPTLEALLEKPI